MEAIKHIHEPTTMEKYILPFLISSLTLLAPAFSWFYIVGFFILADFAVKSLIVIRDNPDNWVSGKAWRTGFKLGVSLIFIIAGWVTETYIVKDVPVMKVMASFMILVELKSLDEKAKEIWGISLFGFIIDKLTPKK